MDEKIILLDERMNEGRMRYSHLVGREFVHGRIDCLDILRRMFGDNWNIEITNYARPDDWWIDGKDLYTDNYRQEGFERIEMRPQGDYNPFDVFLIAIPDSRNPDAHVANHCAVYLGEGHYIHHRLGKLSEVKPYRHSMKDYTCSVIRHKDIPILTNNKGSSGDILDHILPHKRELILGASNERKNRLR